MFGLGLPELIIVGIIAVMLFGKRLPEVARSFGRSYQEFRAGLQDIQTEVNRATRDVERPIYEAPVLTYDEHDQTEEALADHEAATADHSEDA